MKKRLSDTRTLVYFYIVATRGSYRLAARELAISLSALSRPIQQLEKDLGVLLLVRGGRHETQLTPAGQSFLDDAAQVLGGLQEIRRWSDAKSRPCGRRARPGRADLPQSDH